MNMDLAHTAAQLTAPGKGLLASDESTGTIGKRLTKAGLVNDEVCADHNLVPPSLHLQFAANAQSAT